MATYFVGDLQGCYDELQLLLECVNFNPTQDKLYLVGDLVARGDKSLECLRFVKSLGNAAQTVLGNHDLHLIATALSIKKVKPRDRVDAIFNAPDFDDRQGLSVSLLPFLVGIYPHAFRQGSCPVSYTHLRQRRRCDADRGSAWPVRRCFGRYA